MNVSRLYRSPEARSRHDRMLDHGERKQRRLGERSPESRNYISQNRKKSQVSGREVRSPERRPLPVEPRSPLSHSDQQNAYFYRQLVGRNMSKGELEKTGSRMRRHIAHVEGRGPRNKSPSPDYAYYEREMYMEALRAQRENKPQHSGTSKTPRESTSQLSCTCKKCYPMKSPEYRSNIRKTPRKINEEQDESPKSKYRLVYSTSIPTLSAKQREPTEKRIVRFRPSPEVRPQYRIPPQVKFVWNPYDDDVDEQEEKPKQESSPQVHFIPSPERRSHKKAQMPKTQLNFRFSPEVCWDQGNGLSTGYSQYRYRVSPERRQMVRWQKLEDSPRQEISPSVDTFRYVQDPYPRRSKKPKNLSPPWGQRIVRTITGQRDVRVFRSHRNEKTRKSNYRSPELVFSRGKFRSPELEYRPRLV